MPTFTKNFGSQCLTLGLALALGVVVSSPAFAAQRGARGGGSPTVPPANNGGNANRGGARGDGSAAQARQQIQATRKAAVDQANQQLRLAMVSAKADQSSSDPNVRAHARAEIQAAQSAHKQAVEQANAAAKAALAALGNGK